MDNEYYLLKFQKSLDGFNKSQFGQRHLDLKVGIWLDSVVLKIQSPGWLNQSPNAKAFSESIFFSVWVSDDTISQNKIYYNIHALKLRELTDHKIKSRDFAEAFRHRFKPYAHQWPNVSVNYGPLTLMEGWVPLDENLQQRINELATKFLSIAPIINNLLNETKK